MGAGDSALTIQDDPHGPEVHTGIVLPLTHHLGSHVEGRATEHMLLIPGGHVLCKAKVCRQEARQQGSDSSCFCSWPLQPHPGLQCSFRLMGLSDLQFQVKVPLWPPVSSQFSSKFYQGPQPLLSHLTLSNTATTD